MPRPPPPAAALISTGYPTRAATARACSMSVNSPSEPGTSGTPSEVIAALAAILSPIMRIWLGAGPMKVRPCASTISANSAFSDRKP